MCPKIKRRKSAIRSGPARKVGSKNKPAATPPQDTASFWGAALIESFSLASGQDQGQAQDTGEILLQVTQDALDHVDQVLDASEPPRTIVCGPGCVYCCHNQISVTPMEAFGLCAFFETHFDSAEQDRLKAALFDIRDRIRSKTRTELYDMREELVCAFLKNGCCGVYTARPVACRTWHSFDRAACKAAYESPDPTAGFETYPSRREYGEQVQIGLLRGASALGLEAGYLVMTRALALLLENDWRAEMRTWLAGGKIFGRPGRL